MKIYVVLEVDNSQEVFKSRTQHRGPLPTIGNILAEAGIGFRMSNHTNILPEIYNYNIPDKFRSEDIYWFGEAILPPPAPKLSFKQLAP